MRVHCHLSANERPERQCSGKLVQGLEVRKDLFKECEVVEYGRNKKDKEGMTGRSPRAFQAPMGSLTMTRGRVWKGVSREKHVSLQDEKIPSRF